MSTPTDADRQWWTRAPRSLWEKIKVTKFVQSSRYLGGQVGMWVKTEEEIFGGAVKKMYGG